MILKYNENFIKAFVFKGLKVVVVSEPTNKK